MDATYELTLEDLRAFLAWSAGQPPLKQQMERSRFFGTLVFLLMAAIVALSGLLGRSRLLPIVALLLVGAAAISWFTLPRRLVTAYADRSVQGWARGKLGYLVGPRSLRLDAAGFALSGPGLALSYAWQLVDRVSLAPGGVYLFLGSQQAHVVPRSAFASDDDMRRLAETAEAYRSEATHGQPAA